MLSIRYRNNWFCKWLLFESVSQTFKQKVAFSKHEGKSKKSIVGTHDEMRNVRFNLSYSNFKIKTRKKLQTKEVMTLRSGLKANKSGQESRQDRWEGIKTYLFEQKWKHLMKYWIGIVAKKLRWSFTTLRWPDTKDGGKWQSRIQTRECFLSVMR